MFSIERRSRPLAFIIVVVTLTLMYLSFYRNTFGFMNTVQRTLPEDNPSENGGLESFSKIKQVKNKTINCRGKQQNIIQNIFSRDDKGWYENREICDSCFDFPKATLKTKFGPTPIFVYPRDQDVWVSTSLQDRGTFESEKSEIIFKMMKDDPELQIIDIGANIGVYTLSCAKAGRKVLAVEALDKNMQHICASVMEGGLQNNVYLIHNAISNGHKVVNLGVDKSNMGGTFVDEDSSHIKELKLGRAQGTYGKVYTITMDDLLDLPAIKHFKKVFIKMDVEGFEARAVEKATKFFEKIKVVGFVMEWEFHKGQPTAQKIIDFMTARKFKPHAVNVGKTPLNLAESAKWGYDVLWLPS
ncbi:uncharacterized protein LOC134264884 [Saccostrea cucullata]|uniref:uncharacterized protein LOC134264884 n=1 Tax=Saccostrea cuccullata TaxID=36930 RepID=UPI002ED5A651